MSTSADPAKLEFYSPTSAVAPTPVLAKPKRLNYGDPVRILGTIAVVIGHNADMAMLGPVLTHQWWVINFWDACTRWAVPVYIMLSGALLLEPSRNEDGSQFYRKRLTRIGVPLVFWTAFYMWFQCEYTGWETWERSFLQLAEGKPYTHLHFIFRIAGLYFFTPMMRQWLKHTTRRMQWQAVIGALVLSSGDSIMNGITGNEPSVFSRFVPFVGYYMLGYMLRDVRLSALGIAWCIVGAVGSIIMLAMGTGLLIKLYPNPKAALEVQWYPSVQMLLYDFLSPVRILMAICFWLFFVNIFRNPWTKTGSGRKVLAFWASTTLGLYLVHPMFREILYTRRIYFPFKFLPAAVRHFLHLPDRIDFYLRESFGPLWHWHGYWLGLPVVAFAIYMLSIVTTIILMRIPYVRRITG